MKRSCLPYDIFLVGAFHHFLNRTPVCNIARAMPRKKKATEDDIKKADAKMCRSASWASIAVSSGDLDTNLAQQVMNARSVAISSGGEVSGFSNVGNAMQAIGDVKQLVELPEEEVEEVVKKRGRREQRGRGGG